MKIHKTHMMDHLLAISILKNILKLKVLTKVKDKYITINRKI